MVELTPRNAPPRPTRPKEVFFWAEWNLIFVGPKSESEV
jgi:hypothetical protein